MHSHPLFLLRVSPFLQSYRVVVRIVMQDIQARDSGEVPMQSAERLACLTEVAETFVVLGRDW